MRRYALKQNMTYNAKTKHSITAIAIKYSINNSFKIKPYRNDGLFRTKLAGINKTFHSNEQELRKGNKITASWICSVI